MFCAIYKNIPLFLEINHAEFINTQVVVVAWKQLLHRFAFFDSFPVFS